MSERLFQAIDETKEKGLEAMLKAINTEAIGEKDYSTAAEARVHLRRLELGLPPNHREILGNINRESPNFPLLKNAIKESYGEAGDAYEKEEKWEEAASCFSMADRRKKAIEMYLKDGTEDSLDLAAFIALEEGADYKLGIDLRIQRGDISRTLDALSRISNDDERQRWNDYAIKTFYPTISDELATSNKNVLSSHEFHPLIKVILNSSDSKVIEIGLRLNEDQAKYSWNSEADKSQIKDTEMHLRGKLTGNQEYVDYFVQKAEQCDSSSVGRDVWFAMNILEHHKRYNEALQVADRFLGPLDYSRTELLKKLGKTQELATAYRGGDCPLAYALTVGDNKDARTTKKPRK